MILLDPNLTLPSCTSSRRKPMPMPPMMTAAGIPVMPLAYPGPFAAPYTHMSDHSSSDSTEAQEISHDHPHYPHDFVHYPHDPATYPVDPALVAHYPQDPAHYPRPPPRRRSCAHSFQAEREVRPKCSSVISLYYNVSAIVVNIIK